MQSGGRNLNETYDATPECVAQARSMLAGFARDAGATTDRVEAVRLAASEAITNSVLHAYRGDPGLIYVNAAVAAGELWILIADDGCGLKPRADRPGLGLGLGLISQVSDDFAIVSRASGGTEVRIRFNLAGGAETSADRSAPTSSARNGSSGPRPGFTPSLSLA